MVSDSVRVILWSKRRHNERARECLAAELVMEFKVAAKGLVIAIVHGFGFVPNVLFGAATLSIVNVDCVGEVFAYSDTRRGHFSGFVVALNLKDMRWAGGLFKTGQCHINCQCTEWVIQREKSDGLKAFERVSDHEVEYLDSSHRKRTTSQSQGAGVRPSCSSESDWPAAE